MVLGVLQCLQNTVEATSFLPCLQKENAVSIAACYKARSQKGRTEFSPEKFFLLLLTTFFAFG